MMILLVSAILASQAAPDDAAVTTALENFNKAWGAAKGGDQRAAAVAQLSTTHHEKVVAKLGGYTTNDDKSVRLAAVGGLQSFTDTPELRKAASRPLQSALSSGINQVDPDCKIAILNALGALNDDSSWSKVKELWEDKELKVATAAITASGLIKSKNLVEPLIALLREFENDLKKGQAAPGPAPAATSSTVKRMPTSKTAPSSSGPPQLSDADKQKRDRAFALQGTTQSALCTLTNQGSLKTSTDFENWWARNKNAFPPK
jgi:HEAT repeat protein